MAHQGTGHGHGGRGEKSAMQKHGWKAAVVVVLMLAAMAVYIFTLDDSVVPGPTSGPATDAAVR